MLNGQNLCEKNQMFHIFNHLIVNFFLFFLYGIGMTATELQNNLALYV